MIDDLEGKIIAGKYRIDSLLADGEMGPVYRGSNILMDKPVTVKVLVPALAVDKRFVDRFLANAKAVSKAGHPNILNVLDFGTDTRDITYAIYEDVPGESLTTAIARDGSLPVNEAINVARRTARGLAAAHEQGLIHGGLTPDAVFVLKDEAVKVFEFGSQPVVKSSNSGIEYRAPETYDGERADERSDIYSLGVILYEMLTGVVPFVGKTAKELKEKQDSGPPPPLSAFRADIPSDLEPMILSAIAIDPERRYQTMKAFAEDLEMLAGGVPKTEAAASAAPKRNIWQTAFIVLIGVVALAGVLIYATSVKRTDPTTAEVQSDPGSLPVQPIGPATGAQEESLAKLAPMTREEIMAFENSNTTVPPGSTLPGGDGYNAWGNGGVPPAGAPLNAPGGQTMTVQPGGSQFMPGDVVPPGCTMLPSGVILCPKVLDPTVPQPSPAPRNSKGNVNAGPATTPKPFAVPPAGSNTNTSPSTRTTRPARPAKPNGGGPQEEN